VITANNIDKYLIGRKRSPAAPTEEPAYAKP